MTRWLLRKAVDKFERNWGYDASYMRDLIDVSPRAAWLYSRAAALGQFRRDVPLAAWYAAGLTAVRREDCGPCTQLGVTMAERAGGEKRVFLEDGDTIIMRAAARRDGLPLIGFVEVAGTVLPARLLA